MKTHFLNITKILESIYIGWLMTISCILNILFHITNGTYGLSLWFNIFGLFLFVPSLYQYYISKSTNEWGQCRGE